MERNCGSCGFSVTFHGTVDSHALMLSYLGDAETAARRWR